MTPDTILNALREAYKRAGTQSALAQQAGVSQGRIADYLNGRCDICHMEISTLLKIFPDIKIDFFGESSGDKATDLMRGQLLMVFDGLSEEEKMRCLSLVIANFPDPIVRKNVKE